MMMMMLVLYQISHYFRPCMYCWWRKNKHASEVVGKSLPQETVVVVRELRSLDSFFARTFLLESQTTKFVEGLYLSMPWFRLIFGTKAPKGADEHRNGPTNKFCNNTIGEREK
jgi:hypothetical protein